MLDYKSPHYVNSGCKNTLITNLNISETLLFNILLGDIDFYLLSHHALETPPAAPGIKVHAHACIEIYKSHCKRNHLGQIFLLADLRDFFRFRVGGRKKKKEKSSENDQSTVFFFRTYF